MLRSSHQFRRTCQGLVLWAVACLAAPVVARTADRIDSAPLRLEVRGVPQLLEGFADRPWVRQIVASTLFQRWLSSPAYLDARKSLGRLDSAVGGDLGDQVAALFEGGVVVLMEPGTEGPPRSVVVGLAGNEEVAPRFMALWNRAENVTPIAHGKGGLTVWERKPASGQPSVFYAAAGPIWLLGSHAELVQPLLAMGEETLRSRFKETTDEPPTPRITLRFRTQAWSESMDLRVLRESKDPVESWLAAQWDALSLVKMELRENSVSDAETASGSRPGAPGLHFSVEGQWEADRVSPRWQDWVAAISEGRAETFDRVPAGTLVAMGGRLQPRLGMDLLPFPTDETTRREFAKLRRIARGVLLGLDLYEEVLARLPVNWGLFVVPRQPTDKDPLPLGAILAWQMPTPPSNEPEGGLVARSLLNALQTGLTIWSAAENEARNRNAPAEDADPKDDKPDAGSAPGTSLESEPVVAVSLSRNPGQTGDEMFRLEGLPFARPAFSLTSGYLITASHPELIDAFAEASQASERLSTRLETRLAQPELFREKQLVAHVAVASLRTWLRKHQPALAQVLADWRKVPVEEVSRRLDRMGEVFEPFDDLVATVAWRKDAMIFDVYWLSSP